MEILIYLAAITAAVWIVAGCIRQQLIPAPAGDWIVALDVDAVKKVVLVHALPVVAFKPGDRGITPIGSATGYIDALAKRRPAKVEGHGGSDVSAVFSYWLRDGALWGVEGRPVDTGVAKLSGVLMDYLLADFKVFGAGSVPAAVSAEIAAGHELFAQWEFKAAGSDSPSP